MLAEDAESEIKKLKLMRTEIANKISMTADFEEKDDLEKMLSRMNQQIKMLERLKSK